MNLEEIERILAEHKKELYQKYKIKKIGIFGSFARGEQSKESDVDIFVELEKEISIEECKKHGTECGEEPVKHWLAARFNVKESSEFTPRGFIFDTVEISVAWKNALKVYNEIISAMRKVDGVVVASGHASHFYPQGVCFYHKSKSDPEDLFLLPGPHLTKDPLPPDWIHKQIFLN